MSKFNIWGRPPCSKKRNQTQSITINCPEQVRKRPLAKVAYLWQPAHPELCHATPCRAWCMLRIFRAAAATSQDWRWSSTWGFGTSPSRGSYCRDMSGSYTAHQFLRLLRSSRLYWFSVPPRVGFADCWASFAANFHIFHELHFSARSCKLWILPTKNLLIHIWPPDDCAQCPSKRMDLLARTSCGYVRMLMKLRPLDPLYIIISYIVLARSSAYFPF